MEDLVDGALNRAASSLCPGRDQDTAKCGICTGFTLFVISLGLFLASFDTVPPTSYGLLQNDFTGYVDTDNVYNPGRYFVFVGHHFIHFPKTRVTIQFSDGETKVAGTEEYQTTVAPAIKARTGPDPSDLTGESGGQPLDLDVAFQYRFTYEEIPYVYQMFGPAWETSFVRFARQAISNTAQLFTPGQFWHKRSEIEAGIQAAVADALLHQGHARVDDLQLMRAGFSDKYEDIILRVQLQEQLKTTKRYNLTVTEVLKSVDIRRSETEAQIMRINAEAEAEAAIIGNKARMQALELVQSTKALAYKRLRDELGWSSDQFLEYMRQAAINAQPSGNIIVKTDSFGGAGAEATASSTTSRRGSPGSSRP
eukprot:CAMPEP_0185205420 /NCGR_PEP_ID=MMETSP1140-20130426/56613_1 /TAXON_ID=298111 /ORGANISM="Pavlova sp., Strain CCMP459" /LENGTH=366 /DNA_ID=CAMNT_0027773021 /DNA_START=6 /DNA_END=1106 /DNA_ORIENTATION=+